MSLGTLRRLDHHRTGRTEDQRPPESTAHPTRLNSTQPSATQVNEPTGGRDPATAYAARTRFAHESGGAYRAHQIQGSVPPPSGSDTMHVGSYNIAGGAKKEYRYDYGRTHALAAH